MPNRGVANHNCSSPGSIQAFLPIPEKTQSNQSAQRFLVCHIKPSLCESTINRSNAGNSLLLLTAGKTKKLHEEKI